MLSNGSFYVLLFVHDFTLLMYLKMVSTSATLKSRKINGGGGKGKAVLSSRPREQSHLYPATARTHIPLPITPSPAPCRQPYQDKDQPPFLPSFAQSKIPFSLYFDS